MLIPEPADYFAACSATSICEIKCRTEFDAFNAQLAISSQSGGTSSEDSPMVIERTVESMFFTELNEDAFMPMNILAMVELSDCKIICGGLVDGELNKLATGDIPLNQESQKKQSKPVNTDTCIAVAGLAQNNTVSVKKYCIPKMQGQSVRGAPTETWFVWYSEEWSQTLVSLHFADTVTGDTLIALRDNHGQSLQSGHVLEDIVSVHAREMQTDAVFFDRFYGDKQLRLSRQAFTHTTKMDVSGFSKTHDTPLKIAEILVLPNDAADQRKPWILMSYIVGQRNTGITDSLRRDVCAMLDVEEFVITLGQQQYPPDGTCNLQSLFETMRGSALTTVVVPTGRVLAARLLIMPTSTQALVDACLVTVIFSSLHAISDMQEKVCFNTPSDFLTAANFPTRPGWMDLQRSMFLGVSEMTGPGTTPTSMMQLQDGTIVAPPKRRILAQNTLSSVDMTNLENQKIIFFGTSDSSTTSHWLRQVRIAMHPDDSGNMKSVSAQSKHSAEVRLTVITYHSCNRLSCLGCKTTQLQALCYAAQQCSIVKCVGTIVNQNRPLCNIGLVMASYAESSLLMMMGAWTIFTETYTKILDAALLGPPDSIRLEWVDDAFFGYICSAKDTLGQMTSVVTSSVGAGLVTGHNNKRRLAVGMEEAGTVMGTDDGFTASVTMLLNGVNAFLYQLVLLPLYSMIALQKSIVCTSNDVFALFDMTGFTIRVGRPDLQRASDVSAGVCMTEFYDSMMSEMGSSGTVDDFVTALNQFMESSGQMRGAIKAGSISASGLSQRSSKILTLATSKSAGTAKAIDNFVLNPGKSSKPMFERMKNNNLVKKLASAMDSIKLTAPIHALDSMLSYLMGVVSGLEDMAQVIDAPHCKLPDYYIHKAPTCACGDDPVRIPDIRRNEGIREHAHWCTGTLQMQDGFGNLVYVWNPFTYKQLRSLAPAGSIDRYLRCISEMQYGQKTDEFKSIRCEDIRPEHESFRRQGSSLIAVIERCKGNYQQQQWDVGAYLAYDTKELRSRLGPAASEITNAVVSGDGVADCLLRTHRNRESNEGCLQDFLGINYARSASSVTFWSYEKPLTSSTTSDATDACIVFSGPAKKDDGTATTLAFQACSHDYMQTGCMIPHMVILPFCCFLFV